MTSDPIIQFTTSYTTSIGDALRVPISVNKVGRFGPNSVDLAQKTRISMWV
jgi:hypothetical protein